MNLTLMINVQSVDVTKVSEIVKIRHSTKFVKKSFNNSVIFFIFVLNTLHSRHNYDVSQCLILSLVMSRKLRARLNVACSGFLISKVYLFIALITISN